MQCVFECNQMISCEARVYCYELLTLICWVRERERDDGIKGAITNLHCHRRKPTKKKKKKMEGSLIIRVCLLGLLATTAIASLIHRTSEIDSGSEASLADIGARFEKQNVDFYPELPEPTDEEWISIIKGNWPEYMKESNFSLTFNTTGTFSNTGGFKAKWNETTRAFVHVSDGVIQALELDVRSLTLDGVPVVLVELIGQVYREIEAGAVLSARAATGAAFVKHNGTYDLYGRSMSFREGSFIPLDDDTWMVGQTEMGLTNSSFLFTVSFKSVDGALSHKDTHYSYNGTKDANSIPLNRKQVGENMPKTPRELAQLFKKVSSEVTVSFGEFSGDFTYGTKGTYSGKDFTAGFSQSGATANTTSSFHGNYRVGSSAEGYFQLSPTSVMDIIFKEMF